MQIVLNLNTAVRNDPSPIIVSLNQLMTNEHSDENRKLNFMEGINVFNSVKGIDMGKSYSDSTCINYHIQ